MADHEYFEGFDEKLYQEEARERWGSTEQYQQSRRNWSSYSEERKQAIKLEGNEITRRMVSEDPDAKPDDPAVQQAVADYHRYINQYFYHCDAAFFRGLADMWVEDPRFRVNYERVREGGAEFVRNAVQIYCDRALEKGG